MEAKNDMGQVGYVTDKLSELEISKETDESIVDGASAAKYKKAGTCYAEKADGIATFNDEGDENESEYFICSGNGMNLVLDDIGNEKVYKYSTPGKYENRFSLSMFTTDSKNEQEMATKIELPKCESIGAILISSESAKKHDIGVKQDGHELSINLQEEKPEVKYEVDANLAFSDNENEREKWVKLSLSDCEEKVHVVSVKNNLSFTPPERDNTHDLAKILTPSEYNEGKEIAKKLLSPVCEDYEKKENFIYRGHSMDLPLNENEYDYEKDSISSECENILGRITFQTGFKKEEEMVGKNMPSKYVKDTDAISISLESANKHESSTRQKRRELPVKFYEKNLEDIKEIDLNLISSKPENDCGDIMNLYLDSVKKVNRVDLLENGIKNDLSFTPPERENVHNVAMIWSPSDCEVEKEIAKKLLSSEREDSQKKEHFIYSKLGMNFVPVDSENIYKVSKDCNPRKCAKEQSFKTDCKKGQELPPKFLSSKCETEDIGAILITSENINNRDLPEDELGVEHEIDSNLNSSEPENEMGKCMNWLPSESVENRIKNNLSFTPPERDNSRDLAIILPPSEGKPDKEIAKDISFSECDNQREIFNCPLIPSESGDEYLVISGDSSPERNEDIGSSNFVCNECKCERDSSKDLSCFKVKDNPKPSGYLILSECDDAKKNIAIVKSNEFKKKVIFLKNPLSGNMENQQGKDVTPIVSESRKLPTMNLAHGKYARGSKSAINVQEKLQKEASLCQSEFKFGSTTSHTSNEENFQVPSDSLAEKIIRQAEFYFSDFNILKNNFLLKHIRRNKEGFLSLKLVSSFRKIKALTKDWRVVAYSLEGSKLLKLNAEKTKVRRIEKIPKLRDTSYGKTVVVFNLPSKNPTSEDIEELFSKFGTIISAEVVTLKSPNYNIYHKRCRYFNQEISSNAFGVVEFEKYEDALAAVQDKESHLPKENEMKVVPLLPPKYRKDPTNSRSSSSTYISNIRGRFKPRSEMQKGRQVYDSKPVDVQVSDRPPITEKSYRGNYRPRYAWKPRSYTDVQGKLPNDRIIGKGNEVDNNSQVRRQLKVSNTLNVHPFHQQQRGSGRFYPGSRFHGARADV